jgi:hypothetical protein
MNNYSPNDERLIRAELADERAPSAKPSAPSPSPMLQPAPARSVSVENDRWYVRRPDGVTFGPMSWRELTASVHAHMYSGDELVQGEHHPRRRLRDLFPKYFGVATAAATGEIRPLGTPGEQFVRNPVKFLVMGQEMPAFETTDPQGKYQRLRVAIVGTLAMMWLLAMFSLLIAAALSGLWLAAIADAMIASLPFAIGYFTFAGGLLEWEFVLSSRRAKTWRYWFGDRAARWICLSIGAMFMLAGGSLFAVMFFGFVKVILKS